MTPESAIALLVSLITLAYLLVALVKPERF
jgi:K+-transporting ATPase KdpF subunit